MEIEYYDKYHRIVRRKSDGAYVPEFRPLFFRTKLTSWLYNGGWSDYGKSFNNDFDARNFLNRNLIKPEK